LNDPRWKRFAGATPMILKNISAEINSAPAEDADYINAQLKDLAKIAQRCELGSLAHLILRAALEAQLQSSLRKPQVH
jgi:hypothetical protein